MRKALIPLVVAGVAVGVAGCSTRTVVGGVVGAGAAAGGYELNIKRQMDRIENDLSSGAITQEEFDIRKDQIGRDSLIQ